MHKTSPKLDRRQTLQALSLPTLSLLGAASLIRPARAEAPLEGGTLKIVVPYPAGGTSDRAARLLGDALARENGTVERDGVVVRYASRERATNGVDEAGAIPHRGDEPKWRG